MQFVLLGEKSSERTKFFLKAADELGVDVTFIQLPSFDRDFTFDFAALENCAVKIDPPESNAVSVDLLTETAQRYMNFLSDIEKVKGVKTLNSPQAIMQTLDKLICKRALENAGINATPLISETDSIIELRQILLQKNINSVFIKPRLGSGAAGVMAYRVNPKIGEEAVYTSVGLVDGRRCNTNKIRVFRKREEIDTIAGGILTQGAVVEQWIPKAKHNGKNFDLRVVFQFGKVAFIVARQSAGPITNLHLNNDALDFDALDLSDSLICEIEELCRKSVALFPGLNSAGIDILLERGTLKPYIIEINGQGDLIYRDIFADNQIYKSQIKFLMLKGESIL